MKGTLSHGARLAAVAIAAVMLLSACGKSAKQVIAENTPAMQALRGKLNTVVGGLPSLGSAVSVSMAAADPKPVYDRKAGAFNTAFVSVEELKDGSSPIFDLALTSDLSTTLAWTGLKNPMAESRLDEGEDGMSEMFASALATPYVVIYRAASYDKPVAVDATNFTGGTLDLEAFVVPVERNTWIASCHIQADSATEVNYTYKKNEDPKARLEEFARSTLWEDARKKLAACLAEQTGGTFVFDAS